MPRPIATPEKTILRTPGQFSRLYLAIAEYQVVYSALLNGEPTSTDMVMQLTYDGGSGTLADVKADMTLYVGTSAGAFDLGMCRIRKAPTSSIFYIGETSAIDWQDNCHLTVVNDFQLRQKPIRIVSNAPKMDVDIAYSDQHHHFNPVPILGSHIIAKMTGADITVQAGLTDSTASYVFDSTIASVLWDAPTAASIDDATAINPQVTFDVEGWHALYCAVTADNGKSTTGMRWVYIYSDAAPAVSAFNLKSCQEESDSGGWSFSVEMFADTDQVNIRDRALVILFSEDYADAQAVTSPSPITRRENILSVGWVAGESIIRNSEMGTVEFKVEGAQSWMKKIPDFVVGLEFKVGTAAAWTDMPALNIDRALWHLLYWRSTAMTVMDVFLTGDTRYATEFKTGSQNLWERINEIAQTSIFAAPGVDRYGRLFVSIEPQMTPVADRDFVEVDTLTSQDIEGEIRWGRRTAEELALLNFSGVAIDVDTSASAFFSLSPGHVHTQYGNAEQVERILVSGQTQSNALCGLYFGWHNNPLENFEINLAGSYRFADCFPPQYLNVTIAPADDPRGIGFSGRVIPRSISLAHNVETGFVSVSMVVEPESFSGLAIKGDMIRSDGKVIDLSIPPMPDFPPMPPMPPLYPPPTQEPDNQPKSVIFYSANFGVMYTTTFNEDIPTWYFMNNGLEGLDKTQIANLVVMPSGAIYILTNGDNTSGWQKVMVADGLGGMWTQVLSSVDYDIEFGKTGSVILGIGINPLANDEIAVWGGEPCNAPAAIPGQMSFTLGNKNGWSYRGFIHYTHRGYASLLYANNGWDVFCNLGQGIGGNLITSYSIRADAAGNLLTAIVSDPSWNAGAASYGCAAGTQDLAYFWRGDLLFKVTNAGNTFTTQSIRPNGVQGVSFSPTGNFGMGVDYITPMRTSDGGSTWGTAAGAIPIGRTVWENCGDDFRWLCGGGVSIGLTMDWGATYIDKAGNLPLLAALINIVGIRFIE